MTGVAKNTIVKLLVDLGAACAKYQDQHLRNLKCRRIECDEIWSFVYAKQKNVELAKNAPESAGDVWTWTALDADSKLVPSWLIGTRDLGTAYTFMHDLADRLSSRVQLTTDGHRPYLEAVESAFGEDIDFAQLVKVYGSRSGGREAILTGQVSGLQHEDRDRHTESKARQHVIRRASEPHDADEHEAVRSTV